MRTFERLGLGRCSSPALLGALAVVSLAACGSEGDADGHADGALGVPVSTQMLASDHPDGLMEPDFSSGFWPPEIKAISGAVSKVAGYYSDAESALKLATKLWQMMGFMETEDPNARFEQLKVAIQLTISSADWGSIMRHIDTQRGPAVWALGRIKVAGGTLPEGGNEDQSSGSAIDAIIGPSDSAFMRPFVEEAIAGTWSRMLPDRPAQPGQAVYDWRLGAPAMLELIAIRLMVIGAMDPNFRWNGRYDDQLRAMRAAVERHYNKMVGGVRCGHDINGRPLGTGMVCADIHTGAYTLDTLANWYSIPDAAEREFTLQRLRTQVLRGMPLFEMRQMIDTLTLYIDGVQDLTQSNQEIRLSTAANDTCLDVEWGNPNPLTPLQIWPCNGTDAQTWIYDRPSGQVLNPAFGLCLDVMPARGELPDQAREIPGFTNGSKAYTNRCDGSGSQKWTHDPASQQLQNAFGMILNHQTFSPHPDQPMKINALFGPVPGDNSKWRAVQRSIGKRSGLLRRHPSGELRLWDALSGNRFREFVLGAADHSWQPVTTGDFNADGHGDIFWRHSDGFLGTWELQGTTVANYTSTANGITGSVLSGDLDGDHVSDLVWSNVFPSGNQSVFFTEQWLMHPGTPHPRSTSLSVSSDARVVALGNFDGETAGRADIMWRQNNGGVTISLSNGSTTSFSTGTDAWSVKGIGDFNADGTSDILWFHTDGQVGTSVMSGGRPVAGFVLNTIPTSSGWTIQGVADVDGDGLSDIVWRHTDGTAGFWLMNGPDSVRDYPSRWLPTDVTFAGVVELAATRP